MYLSPHKYLEYEFVPDLFDYYNLYFLSNNLFEDQLIYKKIPLSSIENVGLVDHTKDFLSGFNFYLQTDSKLYILSSKFASKTLDWVEKLKKGIEYSKLLDKRKLKFRFKNVKKLLPYLSSSTIKSFMIHEKNYFGFYYYSLNEKFSIHKMGITMNLLKKFINIFKYNQDLAFFAQ